ncbi:flippase [Desulfonatronovibrio magnus]|uniref:flippase n=1 Tax=Desulfonatronovibrio magnus TaxID=698827 RepID=UPI00069780AE|nr:flippase [Desulfonatronovibrio magnus]
MQKIADKISSLLPFGGGMRKIASNSVWLIMDRLIRLGGGLVVSIMLARHLGPADFGIISYALSVTAFLGSFVYLGLSGLVVKDIVQSPDDKNTILGSTIGLKMCGAVFAFLIILGLAFFSHDRGGSEFWTLIIIGSALFFKPFDTIDFWFQSRVESRFTVMARVGAFSAAALVKVVLVFLGAGLVELALAGSLEFFLTAILLVLVYRLRGNSILDWRLRLQRAKELVSRSWILLLSGFLGLIYLKVDQIMLRWIKGPEDVGIYSVASTLSEAWYFIPAVIALSFYPRLIDLKAKGQKQYEQAVQGLLDLLFAFSVFVAVGVTVAAPFFVGMLYGQEYQPAAGVLMIHIWAGVFMFMREVFNKWVLIENLLRFTVVSHGLGAVSNLALNFVLIPSMGVYGAALATLISYGFAGYFFLFLHPATINLGKMMTRSFLLPFRLILKIR